MTTSPATPTNRLQTVPGTYNFRDVGGYRADGGSTAWGQLFRSDALNRLTPEGITAMVSLQIGNVIDLRDDLERTKAPDLLPSGAKLTEHPIFPSALSHINRNLDIQGLTELIFFEHAAPLASAVEILATDAVPTLVHCTAGKDRTGAVIAMALSAVGVDRDDILDDYEQTQVNLAGEWLDRHLEGLHSLKIDITPEIVGLVSSSPLPVMDRALKMIEHEYGSVIDYLRVNGLSASSIESLHTRLVS